MTERGGRLDAPRHPSRLIRVAAAVPLVLASVGVSAQSSAPSWSDVVLDALFEGPEATQLRPATEAETRWRDVPEAERQMVLRDCDALARDMRTLQGAASGGVSDAPPPADAAGVPASPSVYAEACALVGGF